MIRQILILFVLLSGSAFAQSPLTLRHAYELALKQSEQTGIAEANIQTAEAKYRQALGKILPQISFKGSELLQDTSGVSDGGTVGTTLTRFSRPELKFNAKQPIFSGLREFHALRMTRAQKRGNQASFENAKRLLFLDVAKTFYTTLQLQKDTAIVEDIIKTLKDRLNESKRRIELGKARISETVSVSAELATQEAILSELKGAHANSKEVLNFLTGSPPSDSKSPPSENLVDDIELSGIEEKPLLTQRPDVLSQQEALNVAKYNVSVQKGALLPTINAEANYYTHRVGFQENIDWDALFTLEVPLFAGGETRGKIQEAKIKRKQEELKLSEARRRWELESRQALEDFEASQNQFTAYQKAESLSQKNYQLTVQDFQLGVVNHLDFLQALRSWQEARRNLVRTELQTKLNYLSLKVARGEPVP